MKALAVVFAALTLGVTTQGWSQPRRHRAGPAPVLVNIGQCNGMLKIYEMRRRCRDCVSRNGRFYVQGAGRCDLPAPPPPPPPPPPAVLVSVPECNARLAHPGKRARCRHCVVKSGRFHTEGAGPGHCEMPPPPPPPPPAPPVLNNVPECNAHVVRPNKRARCIDCVTHGGRFHKQGAAHGRCEMPPPPPPPPIAINGDQCNSFVRHPGKRARCHNCVGRNGRFHLPGPGRCDLPPPPPPPPPPAVARNAGECRALAGPPPRQVRCRHCVHRGGVFHLAGPGHCSVGAPPPPPPPPPADVITDIPTCNHRLPQKHHRKACKRCVKKGGRFFVIDSTCRF